MTKPKSIEKDMTEIAIDRLMRQKKFVQPISSLHKPN